MIQKKQIKDLILKVSRRQKGLSDQRIMHPAREWFVGIFFMTVLFLLCAGWSVQTYLKNKNVAVAKIEVEAPVTYRESVVEAVIDKFNTREKVLRSLYSDEPPQVVEVKPVATTTASTPVSTSTQAIDEDIIVSVEEAIISPQITSE